MANATTPVPVTAVEVELEFRINAPRPRVWQALTQQVERWWPKQFCAKPANAKAFRLEFKLGGRLYEDWGDGNGWVWWTIHELDAAGFAFSCTGYEDFALHTCVRFSLKEEATCTVLKISDRIWGARAEEAVESHIQGWTWLFEDAFRSFVENPA
jgi:uncharacterized protein YndB with AHSA1/START domain